MQGILFTPDNHKAIRDKLKTQTRRLGHLKEINKAPNLWKWIGYDQAGRFSFRFEPSGDVYNYFPRYRVGETVYIKEPWWQDSEGDIYYKTDWTDRNGIASQPRNGKWKSPLFMPEKYARVYIKITDVRPERLQGITPEDCIAEGIFVHDQSAYESLSTDYRSPTELIKSYQVLWDSINKAYPFDGNYWVWRICFNLIEDKR